jgi:hypothetical protein
MTDAEHERSANAFGIATVKMMARGKHRESSHGASCQSLTAEKGKNV